MVISKSQELNPKIVKVTLLEKKRSFIYFRITLCKGNIIGKEAKLHLFPNYLIVYAKFTSTYYSTIAGK